MRYKAAKPAAEKGTMTGRIAGCLRFPLAALALSAGFLTCTLAQAQAASHISGTVTAINGDTLTVKPAQGDERQVQVPAAAELKRVEPGQTNLSAAVAMQFSELAAGDRVLISIDPKSTNGTPQALRVVAIKAEDLEKKHQQEAQEWQLNGVGGLVKSTNAGAGTIVIASGAGPSAKTIIVHTDSKTILKRYAAASVSYASAQNAPFSAIRPGDELKARGEKNEAGNEVAAAEVVSGSFRNISGVITVLDPGKSTFQLKDLATKKLVTVQVPEEAQMRRLPDQMAQFLAARLKGAMPGRGPGAGPAQGANGGGGGLGQHGGFGQHGGAMDPQQALSRAPAIHFADLKKGDAVMLVATQGDAQATAITLIAGVEPLLEAPASQDLLANWSMNSGSADAGGAQ